MRLVRPVLIIAPFLIGCAPPDDCFEPRRADETDCVRIEAGPTWNLKAGEMDERFEPYCSATCIDFAGPIGVGIVDDLRSLPILPKVRHVDRLLIDISRLPNLRGLEHVDVDVLNLFGSTKEPSELQSLEGLNDDALERLDIQYADRLTSGFLGGLAHLNSLALEYTNVVELDVRPLGLMHLSVDRNHHLTRIDLGGGAMKSVFISRNPALTALTWQSDLRSASIDVSANPQLSSCLVQEFAAQLDPSGKGVRILGGNGPCP